MEDMCTQLIIFFAIDEPNQIATLQHYMKLNHPD